MPPDEIQRRRTKLDRQEVCAWLLLKWIHDMRPIPWDESPAELEEKLLKMQAAIEFDRMCLDILEEGCELPPLIAVRFYGRKS